MNLPESLAREIGRVTELREQYQSMAGMPGINVAPAVVMMDAALERAKAASGSPDIEGQIHALNDLQGFSA